MSQIIVKAFDAGKKIIRSVFKGSPNLFTSSDLNRQIEAIKYQLDLLDEKTGFISDMDLSSATLSDSDSLSVTPTFSTIEYKGCNFNPQSKLLQTSITSQPAYLALFAKVSEVTYDEDSSHEIAGAKFADGTSQPAANQLIYTDEKLALIYKDYTPNEEVDGKLLGVIAMFQRTSQGTLTIKKNYSTGVTDTVPFRVENTVVNSYPNIKGEIIPGMSYDQALNILQNRLNTLKNPLQTTWIDLMQNDTPTSSFRCKITDGVMYLRIKPYDRMITMSYNNRTIVDLAFFPTTVNQALIEYFSKLMTVEGIDYETFGTCYAINDSADKTGTYRHKGDIMQVFNLCLFFHRDNNNSTKVSTVSIGAVQTPIEINLKDNSVGQISFNGGMGNPEPLEGTIIVPETVAAIPLPGLNW